MEPLDLLRSQSAVPTVDEIVRKKLLAQNATVPALQPDEADSLLTRVSNAGLGALHYVGSTLDKTFGGRAIRGGLSTLMGADKGRELLSVLPGSDLMGLTNESDRVSGEDLLKQGGFLQGDGEKGTFELRDLAGPAVEMALDPGTYLTLGTGSALTKAGRVAKDAGILPGKATARIAGFAAGTPELSALAAKAGLPESELAGKALSGLAGFGLPFSRPSTIVGTGDTGKAVAGWLAKKADGLVYGRVGSTLSRLFDSSVHGATNPEAQRVAREVLDPALNLGHAEALGRHVEAGKILEQHGLLDHSATPKIRRIVEGIDQPTTAGEQAYADYVLQAHKRQMAEAGEVGRPLTALSDTYAEYGHRQLTPPPVETPGFAGGRRQSLNPRSQSEIGRQDILRDFVEGTDGVNRMGRDEKLRALIDPASPAFAPLLAQQHIRRNYLGHTAAEEAAAYTRRMNPLTPADPGYAAWAAQVAQDQSRFNTLEKQAGGLADWLKDLDPAYAANSATGHAGHDLFGNSPLTDLTLGQLGHARAQAGAKAIHQLLANNATAAATADTVPLTQALQAVGLEGRVLNASTGVSRGGPAYLLSQLQKTNPASFGTASLADLDALHVPRSLVQDASRFAETVHAPEAIAPIVKAFDTLTNLTKAGQTSLWPSFHARNMVTGLWQNLVTGAADPRYSKLNPMAYVRPYLDAAALKNNGAVAGAADIYRHLNPTITDAEATRLLAEEMFTHSARVNPASTQAMEAIGKGTIGSPVPLTLPGSGGEKTLLDTLNPAVLSREIAAEGKTGLSQANPLSIRGVGDTQKTGFLPVRYGQELGAAGDDLNRISSFIAQRRQGVEAAEASARSRAAHYDYSNLTDFERQVMRRVIPFYSWTRQNVPFQLGELAARPGGVSGAAIRTLDDLRAQGGFVPDQVSEGMAIPVGKEDNGQTRFLTHFGLPVEDAFSFLGTGQNPIQRTGEKLLGMANPLIKMPAELIANKQFYSGRHLDDLYSQTGEPVLDQVLMNSPLSRVMTTARQAADPRKTAGDFLTNFLGPAKITDVDTDKAREVAGRDILTAALKQGNAAKSFETMYVPKENLANLSPEEFRLYQLYKYLESKRQADAKKPKAGVP